MEIEIKHIPCANLLSDLWDKHGDFRLAFVEWCELLGPAIDKVRGEELALADFDEEALRDACSMSGIEQVRAIGEVLRPLWGRLTLPAIARTAELPLRRVVDAVIGAGAGDCAERYAAAEADLLENGPRGARKAWARSHGITDLAAQRLSAVHGVAWRLYRYEKTQMRQMVEEIVNRDGETRPRVIMAELEKHFPAEELPIPNTISVWVRRMERS